MNIELNEYLQRLIRIGEYPVTIAGNKPNFLTRWLVKVEAADEKAFTSEPFLRPGGRIVSSKELQSLPEPEMLKHWRYYESSCVPYYENICNVPETLFPGRHDLYIYCLANIYSRRKELVLINLHSNRPARLWVNGQLAYTGSYFYHVSPYQFMVELQPGNNPVLLEKMKFSKSRLMPPDGQQITITLKPAREIVHNHDNYPFYETSLLDECRTGFAIVPTKAFYGPDEEIQFTVLCKKISPERRTAMRINIRDLGRRVTHTMIVNAGESISFGNMDLYKGLLQISIAGLGSHKQSKGIFVYRGNWKADLLQRIESLESQGVCRDITAVVRHILSVPDCDKGYVSNSFEILESKVAQYLFEKTRELYTFCETHPAPPPKTEIRTVFPHDFPLVKNLPNGGSIAYTIFLPSNYRPGKKYPLVVEMEWPCGKYFPRVPDFVAAHRFDEAIVVCMRGMFDDCNDYIYEYHTLQVIKEIAGQYRIDRDRIYLMGVCGGASKVFYMALRLPDLCTGLIALSGLALASQGELKNITNVMVYQLSNIEENEAQYGRFISFLPYFPKIRHWSFYDLLHAEMNEIYKYSNRLFNQMLKERREIFPKKIHFIALEPFYNKCHWVIVQSLTDLRKRGFVNAEITHRKVIAIVTDNVEKLFILASVPDMFLNKYITLRVNNREQKLRLPLYARLEIAIQADSFSVNIFSLAKGDFYETYQQIGINPRNLGLKEIYLDNCVLVKPEYLNAGHKTFSDNLFYKLQQPVKKPVNDNLSYSILPENQITAASLAEVNFIYTLAAGEIDSRQTEMLHKVDIHIAGGSLQFRGEIYTGEYFALIKTKNPYQEQKNALWIIYQGAAMENALLNFLDLLFGHKYAYSDALICHGEILHAIRYENEYWTQKRGGVCNE